MNRNMIRRIKLNSTGLSTISGRRPVSNDRTVLTVRRIVVNGMGPLRVVPYHRNRPVADNRLWATRLGTEATECLSLNTKVTLKNTKIGAMNIDLIARVSERNKGSRHPVNRGN